MLVAVFATVAAGTRAFADYTAEVLADSPVAYWTLDDDVDPASDETGNGHTANLTMAVAEFDREPLHLNADEGQAVAFSGNGQLTTAPFEKMDGGGFTVEFWIKFNSGPTGFTNLVGDGEAGGDFMLMVYTGGN